MNLSCSIVAYDTFGDYAGISEKALPEDKAKRQAEEKAKALPANSATGGYAVIDAFDNELAFFPKVKKPTA